MTSERDLMKASYMHDCAHSLSPSWSQQLAHSIAGMIVVPNGDSSDSEDLDLSLQTPRETSMEIPQEEVYKGIKTLSLLQSRIQIFGAHLLSIPKLPALANMDVLMGWGLKNQCLHYVAQKPSS